MLSQADYVCVFVIIKKKKKSSCWLKLQAKCRAGMIFDNSVCAGSSTEVDFEMMLNIS